MYSTPRYLLIPIVLALALTGPARAALHLSCAPDNDLHRVLVENRIPCARHDGPARAVERAEEGDGVLILADGYPAAVTEVPPEIYAAAARKGLRLYVEFPGAVPGLKVGGIRAAGLVSYERAVVTSGFFGGDLAPMRVMTLNGCHTVEVSAAETHLVLANVAGYNTAAYGLAHTPTRPILFEPEPGRVLVATTKLSHFARGRYGPKAAWQQVWKTILRWADPDLSIAGFNWTETVRPMYGRDEALPDDAVAQAVRLGTDMFTTARFLIGESWKDLPDRQFATGVESTKAPDPKFTVGDGRFGILEGHAALIDWDGTQLYRYCVRADCQAESALALALRAKLIPDEEPRVIAANLMDYLYFTSPLRQGPRNDPESGSYGLVGWGAFPRSQSTYYGDDNARIFLGSVGAASLLKTDRWDRSILELILANFRTTGRHGFRGDSLKDHDLQTRGWQAYWQSGLISLHPHFEAWIWNSYLWLYHKVGDDLLLTRTRSAIRRLMEAYPNWNWTNGIQQERARMILTLAWLIRVDDTPEHRAWLKRIVTDVLSHMGPEGAIREEIGREGQGAFGPPRSNAAYGTGEAPLIHDNGDPAADMLYTMNFAFFGLNEAARATGDRYYRDALDRMADFLLRIQARSETHPDFNGAWFRAFDTERWEFWSANADGGWGAWSTQTGWSQNWIASTLVLRELNTSLWELTRNHPIARHYNEIRERMLPDSAIEAVIQRPIRHAGVGGTVHLATAVDRGYPGSGAPGLVDGLPGPLDHTDATWLGFQGVGQVATVDLGRTVRVGRLAVGALQSTATGIYLPARVEFSVSDDGTRFTPAATVLPRRTPQTTGTARELMVTPPLTQVSGRYVRAHIVNLGTIPAGLHAAGSKAWIFLDEIVIDPVPPPPAAPQALPDGSRDAPEPHPATMLPTPH
jgi:hypothetical protein